MKESKTTKRRPSFLRQMWRDPACRLFMSIIAILLALFIVINYYTAHYVYKDSRCFWVDCTIVKGDGEFEILRVGDDD